MKRKPLVWPTGDPKLLGWPPHIHKIIDSLSSETSNANVPIYFIDPKRTAHEISRPQGEPMKLELHDANVSAPVRGKMSSPTHAGTVAVAYEYQAEQLVIDIEKDHPNIVRIILDNGRRQWSRIDGRFVELSEGEKPWQSNDFSIGQ